MQVCRMICLTGDVHQEYDSGEQSCYEGTEFEAALEYVEIARSYDIDLTLFLTGAVTETNAKAVRALDGRTGVEVGGHTWNAFRPQWLHRTLFLRLFGSVYGPKLFQRRDIDRTLSVLEACLGRPVRSWRTHAYESNAATYEVLSASSVAYVSDEKDPDATAPFAYDAYDLVEFPINVLPDHEHLYHGPRTRESVQHLFDIGWSDAFGPESYDVDQWHERVLGGIDSVEAAGGVATLLVHPGCMSAVDGFETFERICDHVASNGYGTRTMQDAAPT